MRARDLAVGQTFYVLCLGVAISPYLTVSAVESSSGAVVRITASNGETRELKANQRVRVVTKK
ncbi:MAG TPA: hypothetical protein VFH06_05010 [Candidatus Saccharimonadales bacterium]|nr:hypothetical protein [Candidatus Saccharimonadales bacterium]